MWAHLHSCHMGWAGCCVFWAIKLELAEKHVNKRYLTIFATVGLKSFGGERRLWICDSATSSSTVTEPFDTLGWSNILYHMHYLLQTHTHTNCCVFLIASIILTCYYLSCLSLSSRQTNNTRALTTPHGDWPFQLGDLCTDWLKDVLLLCRGYAMILCNYYILPQPRCCNLMVVIVLVVGAGLFYHPNLRHVWNDTEEGFSSLFWADENNQI